MELQLMKIRKAAGYSNRDDFADKIGVNRYTYRSWESGAAVINAEQLWDLAVALGCSPNDILGWKEERATFDNPSEHELINCYRSCTPSRQDRILDTARDAAGMSKETSECSLHQCKQQIA